jgi:hypothetical protein
MQIGLPALEPLHKVNVVKKVMLYMQKALSSLITLSVCAFLALGVAAQAQEKVDPTGTWTWTVQGRQGGADRVMTLTLKLAGDKLTGEIASPGRNDQVVKTEISDGKLAGDQISFSVTREFNGNKMTSKYSGKVTATTIKGKIETERNGQAQSRDWEAKREVKK